MSDKEIPLKRNLNTWEINFLIRVLIKQRKLSSKENVARQFQAQNMKQNIHQLPSFQHTSQTIIPLYSKLPSTEGSNNLHFCLPSTTVSGIIRSGQNSLWILYSQSTGTY